MLLSIKQYCLLSGYGVTYVHKCFNKGKILPGIIKYEKVDTMKVLLVLPEAAKRGQKIQISLT